MKSNVIYELELSLRKNGQLIALDTNADQQKYRGIIEDLLPIIMPGLTTPNGHDIEEYLPNPPPALNSRPRPSTFSVTIRSRESQEQGMPEVQLNYDFKNPPMGLRVVDRLVRGWKNGGKVAFSIKDIVDAINKDGGHLVTSDTIHATLRRDRYRDMFGRAEEGCWTIVQVPLEIEDALKYVDQEIENALKQTKEKDNPEKSGSTSNDIEPPISLDGVLTHTD